jgi:hypothetical protein
MHILYTRTENHYTLPKFLLFVDIIIFYVLSKENIQFIITNVFCK